VNLDQAGKWLKPKIGMMPAGFVASGYIHLHKGMAFGPVVAFFYV
jgi:hypothetical protein